jgi:transcriptional regulator with XRE-family HTH domain
MSAPSEPAAPPVELARRLRSLRQERSIPQRRVADALGVSVSLVSAWESETNSAVPPPDRMRDLATFYGVEKVQRSAGGRVPADDELSSDEQDSRDKILAKLKSLPPQPARPAATATGPQGADNRSPLRFPPGEDIRIVCGKLDQPKSPDGEDAGHIYTNPDDLNHTDLLTFADVDALIELFGFLRKVNPSSDVRFIRSDRLQIAADSADDLTSHLILLGGVGLNDLTRPVLRLAGLPIKQTRHQRFLDKGEVFEITEGDRKGEQVLPEVEDDVLLEDVGLLGRAVNPYHSGRTLTIFNGVFARGVVGSVRALTDEKLRGQNESYLNGHFADTNTFAILMRVPVLVGRAQTPDLQNARMRLYEWRGDVVPRKHDSSGREMTG